MNAKQILTVVGLLALGALIQVKTGIFKKIPVIGGFFS